MSNSNKNQNSYSSTLHNLSRNAYDGKVINEALNRAGNNPQLKGIIHEILIKDSINANPINIIKGVNAQLSNSANAKTVDIVVKEGSKIISRIQAKDTPASISKMVSQIKSGQYNSAKILCTPETVKNLGDKLTKEGIKKTVSSSGISSNTTSAIAAKAGVTGMSGIGKACMSAAKSSAIGGGVISAGITAIGEVNGLLNGEKTLGEAAGNIAKSGAIGTVSAMGASAAATFTGGVVATSLASAGITGALATTCLVGAPVLAAVGIGAGICSLIGSIFD